MTRPRRFAGVWPNSAALLADWNVICDMPTITNKSIVTSTIWNTGVTINRTPSAVPASRASRALAGH